MTAHTSQICHWGWEDSFGPRFFSVFWKYLLFDLFVSVKALFAFAHWCLTENWLYSWFWCCYFKARLLSCAMFLLFYPSDFHHYSCVMCVYSYTGILTLIFFFVEESNFSVSSCRSFILITESFCRNWSHLHFWMLANNCRKLQRFLLYHGEL